MITTKNPNSKPRFFYSNRQLPQYNIIGFMAIRTWKSNFNVKAPNPIKDRIKRGKKILQFDMITDQNQKSKKTKLFEKAQIKNLEGPYHTILHFFWQKF